MIDVLVIDDSKLIYEGLQAVFASDEEISIVGYAKNGKEAIEQIANSKHQPDVVLVDVLMPVMGGIETTKEISRLFPEIKTIVLSSFEDEPPILEAIAAGAKGYLLKNALVQDISSAIRSVDRGSAHFAPRIIDSLAKNVQQNYQFKKVWWKWPLQHRRAIGIFAFAAAVAHAFYATFKVLKLDLSMMLALPAQSKWDIVVGIISLVAMTPAAVTSFQFFQRKLGKKWRQIHLLTLPALALAIIHTVLVGPHYMATFEINMINYVRILGVIIAGALVFLMRRKIFWSTLGLNKISK